MWNLIYTVTDKAEAFTIGLPLLRGTNGQYDTFGDYFVALITLGIQIAGAVSVAIVVYAGFMYAQSEGNAQKISGAKELVSGALIGMSILILIKLILPTLNIKTN